MSQDPKAQFPSMYPYSANPLNGRDDEGEDWYDLGGEQLEWRDGSNPVLMPGFDNALLDIVGKGKYAQSLGANVLWGKGRLHEMPNQAHFELYLEANLGGPVGTLTGNTMSADPTQFATLREGLYPTTHGEHNDAPDLRLRDGNPVRLKWPNPNPASNYYGMAWADGILFHIGNPSRESLWNRAQTRAYSEGCQTGSHADPAAYRIFMQLIPVVTSVNYYLTRDGRN